MAVFLACPLMSAFTIGALGMAAAIGIGKGAVLKLVPLYSSNTVTFPDTKFNRRSLAPTV